ncbi:hypothetical protein D3C87_1305430 [compost metagenome]
MTDIKERPILFSAPMVRAILEGRKTVTRRAIKPQPGSCDHSLWPNQPAPVWGMDPDESGWRCGICGNGMRMTKRTAVGISCPYGKPGDRLWVRETWMDLRGTGVEHRPDSDGPLQRYAYRADSPPGSHADEARKYFGLKWKPSIHIPRVASRILLEITEVRVERLQDISDEQAKAEGIIPHVRGGWHWHPHNPSNVDDWHQFGFKTPVWAFQDLWAGINGQENWDANPWVWVVELKRVTP